MRLTDTIRAAWDEPELRQRILFIFAMFGVYAIGIHVQSPIGGLDPEIVKAKIEDMPFFQMMNMFGGGALARVSIFSLGLNPYITSSIIMQLMTVAIPALKKEQQEGGQYERMKKAQRTRALTLVLCGLQAFGIIRILAPELPINAVDMIQVVLVWTAGAMMVLWLGEQIQEKGIGQGVSLMIFAGIVVSFPGVTSRIATDLKDQTVQYWNVGFLLLIFVAMTAVIVYFTQAQRRITIQHMRRSVGTKVLPGASTYLPIPVNAAGVIPIIFAFALVFMPAQFASFAPGTGWEVFWIGVSEYLSPTPTAIWYQWVVGSIMYGFLIFFFTYFWTAIQYNVEDIAANLKRSGAYIPGVRQGKQTEHYLDQVISRITMVGALFLSFVALVPFWAPQVTGVQGFRIIGGTSLLIIVSVVLDLMRQIEANLIMRGYAK
ncbi:MAG: preprotein translocase subunit SecY [Armatimonadetes bacterium]|nr:preprotein translocase subunit SecY [Armatimonadota bacterium]